MNTNFKIILTLVFLTGMFLQNGNAANKYSVATGNWNSTATWSLTSGGSSGAAVPVTGDVVIIEGSFNVTVNANTASLTSLTIDSLSTLTATVGFTVSATTITVKGLYLNGSTGTITGTMTVGNGGTYQHAINGGTIKTATWIAGSTCNVSGTTSSVPSGLNQSFKNFTWSSTNTSAISISPTAINGDFNITAGGSTDKNLRINSSSFTIGGNMTLSGTANLQISSSTQRTLTVNGDFSMTGGKLDFATSTKVGTLNIKGDYSHTGGTITETGTSTGAIFFNGSTIQSYTSGGTVSGTINYTVNSGTTLQMADASTIVYGNAFTLNSGATLGIKSTAGITTSGATGNVQSTTRTYSTSANYIYNGSAAQVTGNALTTTANLTINNSTGVTASSNLTVNGILNLQSANPSATKGALEMVTNYGTYPLNTITSNVLSMGSSATTVGIGDVTGKVKRATIVSGVSNTFGNEKTTITYTALSSPTGTMPTDLIVTIMIGSVIGGKTTAVKRSYEVIPTMPGGANTNSLVAANLHYLDGELLSNTESKLVTWDCDIESNTYVRTDEHGRASYDITTTNYKYIGVSNVPASYFIQSWRTIFFVADYVDGPKTWTGTTSVDWHTSTNWNPVGVPSEGSRVIIPSTSNQPTLTTAQTIQSLSIESGATVTLNDNLILKGGGIPGSGAFLNVAGTLNVNSNKITFQDLGGTFSGTANLYDVEISAGSSLTNELGSIMRISGMVTKTGTWFADVYNNTVEYNGSTAQNIIPTDGTSSYSNLVLSGSGSKSATGNLSTALNFTVGSVFSAGAFNHTIAGSFTNNSTFSTATGSTISFGGNFVNNGTFTSTGSSITMNGTASQTISGTNIEFDNLTLSNSVSTILGTNITVRGNLLISSSSIFDLIAYTCNRVSNGGELRIVGTMKIGGNSGGQTGSNFPFNFATMTLAGGIVEYYGSSQTIFNGATYNSLLISGNGTITMPSNEMILDYFILNNNNGVSLLSNITINKALNLTNGILTLGTNNITLGFEAVVAGTPSATNMVVATGTGELRKVFAGTGSFEFPVGSNSASSEYSPVTLNFSTGTFSSAFVGVKLDNHKHPNNTSVNSYIERYWTVTQSGITNFSCAVTFQYLYSDVVGIESDLYCGKYDGSNWTLLSLVNLESQELTGTVTSFSTFTGGEQGVLPVALSSLTSSITGRNIKLNWVTSSEQNNSGFEVERATVTKETPVYTKTGFVTGKGTINTPTNYSYEDRNLQTGKYKYRLKQIDNNGNFAYFNLNGEVEVGVPTKYELSQNYPNPFNPKTKINFEIPYDSKVKMIIYDVTGREIKTIVNEIRTAGYHTIVFDGSDISSGIYFYRIIANANGKDYISTKKMAIIK